MSPCPSCEHTSCVVPDSEFCLGQQVKRLTRERDEARAGWLAAKLKDDNFRAALRREEDHQAEITRLTMERDEARAYAHGQERAALLAYNLKCDTERERDEARAAVERLRAVATDYVAWCDVADHPHLCACGDCGSCRFRPLLDADEIVRLVAQRRMGVRAPKAGGHK